MRDSQRLGIPLAGIDPENLPLTELTKSNGLHFLTITIQGLSFCGALPETFTALQGIELQSVLRTILVERPHCSLDEMEKETEKQIQNIQDRVKPKIKPKIDPEIAPRISSVRTFVSRIIYSFVTF